mgnify:CR=1 FL=1
MKKLIFLCMLVLCPLYSWATCSGTNSGDVSMTNLPEKILVNAGSYTVGTVLYDSGNYPRANSIYQLSGQRLCGICLVLEQCRGA